MSAADIETCSQQRPTPSSLPIRKSTHFSCACVPRSAPGSSSLYEINSSAPGSGFLSSTMSVAGIAPLQGRCYPFGAFLNAKMHCMDESAHSRRFFQDGPHPLPEWNAKAAGDTVFLICSRAPS